MTSRENSFFSSLQGDSADNLVARKIKTQKDDANPSRSKNYHFSDNINTYIINQGKMVVESLRNTLHKNGF